MLPPDGQLVVDVADSSQFVQLGTWPKPAGAWTDFSRARLPLTHSSPLHKLFAPSSLT